MTQRKHKSGKPGSRSGRDGQRADRQGKSAPGKASGSHPDERRGGRPKEHHRRDADAAPRGPQSNLRSRDDRVEKRPSFRAAISSDGGPQSGGKYRGESRSTGETEKVHFPKNRPDQRPDGPYWLFGQHPVTEAIRNPQRKIQRLLRVGGADHEIMDINLPDRPLPLWEPIERQSLDQLLPEGAVHQGIAAKVAPLPDIDLMDICDTVKDRTEATLIILDQVTDPHNVGAILRSAAAFNALAVILTERHAAPENGTLAKSASGALEHVPLIRVGNLARAMEQLKAAGFWLAGLAAEGKTTLAAAKLNGKIGLVMGAEGSGLRRLTRDHCDLLVRLPTSGAINHLNVSNAAAVALYELARLRE
jgi:23S rRNA (guanosine2251-2'-O)-methyltransferase